MADDQSEKKHAPTERKLRDAREKGSIKRSNDLPKAAVAMLFVLAVVASGGALAASGGAWMAAVFKSISIGHFADTRFLALEYVGAIAAFLVSVFIGAMLSAMVTGGWMMTFILLAPKLERLSPGESWKQVFSLQNVIEVLKSIVKIAVIGGGGLTAFVMLRPVFATMTANQNISLATLGTPALVVIAVAAGGASLVAAVDVGIQIWLNRRMLRMTDQELRDEMRGAEGDPHVRARRRAMARRMAQSRQIKAVRTASAVIVNPEHYAVALRYRRDSDPVPFVVAKGVDLAAAPIIEEARIHGIPLVEAPPLARALHRFVEIEQPVPAALYRAVAEVLAYVWRLDAWRRSGGDKPARPWFPASLEFVASKAPIAEVEMESSDAPDRDVPLGGVRRQSL